MASSPRSIERCKRLKIRRKSLTQDGGARPGWTRCFGWTNYWPSLGTNPLLLNPISNLWRTQFMISLLALGHVPLRWVPGARFSHSIGQIVRSFLAIWRRNGSARKSYWPVMMEEASEFSHLPLSQPSTCLIRVLLSSLPSMLYWPLPAHWLLFGNGYFSTLLWLASDVAVHLHLHHDE